MKDSTASERTEDNHCNVDVLIIGAGASGLQCGSDLLENSSLSFRIVEARDRVGGRIFTTTETKSKVISAGGERVEIQRDYGASWIHGIGEDGERNPIVDLLCLNNADTDDDICRVFDGNPWTRPDYILHRNDAIAIYLDRTTLENDSREVTEGIKRHYELQRKLSSFADQLYESGDGMKTVQMSVQESREILLKQKCNEGDNISECEPMVEKLYPFYTFLCENWNGISATELQLSSMIGDSTTSLLATDESYTNQGDYPGAHCKLKCGMLSVIKPFAAKLEDYTSLGERVQKIDCLKDSVLVTTSNGTTIKAKCCVSTIPLGCLKATAESLFHPKLGEDKLEAIRSISAGGYKKVFLTFTSIFWPVDKPLIGLIRDHGLDENGTGKYLLINNLWAKDGIPCLEAVLCGDAAKWAFRKPDESIKSYVLAFLQDTMPVENIQEYCVDCHVTRWEESSLTSGSYSSFTLGTLERHVDMLAATAWDGRLIFAGEATESEHMGSVHAALLSGKRAASCVLKQLSGH